jgi:hypothetical protein
MRAEMSVAHGAYREQAAHDSLHRRTPGTVADLFIGWEQFLCFAREAEALTHDEAEVYRARLWNALIEVAHCQSEHQCEANPADRFLVLLRSAITTGRAHVATRDGGVPDNPGTWGWRESERSCKRRAQWLSQGVCVGWLDRQDLFLNIDAAYQVAQAVTAGGDGIAVSVQTIVRRLHDSGRLKSVDQRRGKLRVRRIIRGARREVLHLRADMLENPLPAKNRPNRPIGGHRE